MINLQIDPNIFNPVYLKYGMKNEKRTQIYFGGASSGKSFAIVGQRTVLDLIKGERNYLICRNVASTMKGSVWNEVRAAIENFELTKCFDINKSDREITCNLNGYQAFFRGLDNPEKIKSIRPKKGVITDVLVEEATECEKRTIKQLYKRQRGLSKVKKRLTLLFNPIIKSHWIYEEYFGIWDDSKKYVDNKDLSILKTTYKDNKFLTPEDIYDLENETDKYYYEVYTLGNWGVLGAVIFKNWKVKDLSEIRKFADKFKNGLDFGYASDPAALSHTYYDKKRSTIYVLEELYETQLTNDALAERIKSMIDNQYVVCDSAEPKSIQELKNFGVSALAAKKGKDSVNFGIDWLQRQTVVVDIHCQNMKNELSQYKWKEDKDGNVLPIPIDKNCHLIDALRYAYEDEMEPRKAYIDDTLDWDSW